MKRNSARLAGLLSMITLLCSPASYGWEPGKTYRITILHTNDHHGRFWHNARGEYGLAAQQTLVKQIRTEVVRQDGIVLLLSGGDINTGVPESDMQDAEPDFRGMSAIGYDAMAIGNHEFDKPLTVLRQQQKWASFPLLSANIYQKSSGKRLFKPWAIFNRQGIKIAVLGLTTDDTARIGNPEHLRDIEFRPPAAEARRVVETLRATEKPDIVIAATHMGHYDDGQHGSNAPGDVEMARALPAGYLDLIVGGHSQDPVCMRDKNHKQPDYVPGTPCRPDRQNGTWIVQAHEWGKYVGRADFTFRDGKLTLEHYALLPVNLKKKGQDGQPDSYYTAPIRPDPQLLALLTPYQQKGQQQLNQKVGETTGYLEGRRHKVRFEQTNLSRLILAALMERTGADFAVMSGGGVRDSLPAGPITYKDVLKVQPFGNTVVYIDLPGRDIPAYLAVVANKQVDSGGYAQMAHLSLVADGRGVRAIKINGQPLQPDKTYRLATLSFNGAGGDGYPRLDNRPGYVNTGFIDAEVLKAFIEKHSPIDAHQFDPHGEIVYQPQAESESAAVH